MAWTEALPPGELRRVLREQAGLDLAALVPADGGESASTFLATGQDGTVSVLKISPGATADSLGRLRELVARLRRPATARSTWRPCCSTCTTATTSASDCKAAHSNSPAGTRSTPTSRT